MEKIEPEKAAAGQNSCSHNQEKSLHQNRAWKSPNDLKLSDRRSRRGPCGKAVGAWAVTAQPVRCSAWLGVGLASDKTWQRVWKPLALAGSERTAGDEKRELSERMDSSRDQNRGCAGVVAKPRGSGRELGTEMEREAWKRANILNLG